MQNVKFSPIITRSKSKAKLSESGEASSSSAHVEKRKQKPKLTKVLTLRGKSHCKTTNSLVSTRYKNKNKMSAEDQERLRIMREQLQQMNDEIADRERRMQEQQARLDEIEQQIERAALQRNQQPPPPMQQPPAQQQQLHPVPPPQPHQVPPPPPHQYNAAAGEQLLNGLVNHLQYLNINIKVPKFSDNINPLEFLNDLEKYFRFKNVRPEHQLVVIESLIDGRVKLWYEIVKDTLFDFNSFKSAFKNEFYSIPVRVKFKSQWMSRKYNKTTDGTMQTFFYKQLREARYFDPPLTPYEINYSIMQQFPPSTRVALSAVNLSDSNLVAQALFQIDGTHSHDVEKHKEWRQPAANHPKPAPVNSLQVSHSPLHFHINPGPYFNSRVDDNHNLQQSPMYSVPFPVFTSMPMYSTVPGQLNCPPPTAQQIPAPTVPIPDTRYPPPPSVVQSTDNINNSVPLNSA